MIDISSATVERVIVHRVGNKGRDEGFTLSQHETPKSDAISDLILENYLSVTVRRNEVLEFYRTSPTLHSTRSHGLLKSSLKTPIPFAHSRTISPGTSTARRCIQISQVAS